MGAPKNNQFWKLRSKHGRDKLFATPELLLEAAYQYFEWCENNPLLEQVIQKIKINRDEEEIRKETINKLRPFTLHGLCIYLNCSTEFFRHFEENNKDAKDFMPVLTRIREIIYNQKFTGAASGFFNANIIARDLGLTDKQEQSVTLPQISKEDLLSLAAKINS